MNGSYPFKCPDMKPVSFLRTKNDSGITAIVFLMVLSWVSAGNLLAQANRPVNPRILIAYHSSTGHTRTMAEAVYRGAKTIAGVDVEMKIIQDVRPEDLVRCQAIILGSPVQNANPAPEVLSFIRSWPFDGETMKNKIGAVFTSAGGMSAGEELVQMSLIHAMMVYGMVIVGGEEWTSAFGASAITDEKPFQSGTMDPVFLRKAELLGKRVSKSAVRWNKN